MCRFTDCKQFFSYKIGKHDDGPADLRCCLHWTVTNWIACASKPWIETVLVLKFETRPTSSNTPSGHLHGHTHVFGGLGLLVLPIIGTSREAWTGTFA
jgi:hypothetical protein